jgi:hypothetical protein
MVDAVRLRILLVALAGWVNRHQLEVIAYLREENRVLKEQLAERRLPLTDAQRRRLAVKVRDVPAQSADHQGPGDSVPEFAQSRDERRSNCR